MVKIVLNPENELIGNEEDWKRLLTGLVVSSERELKERRSLFLLFQGADGRSEKCPKNGLQSPSGTSE